MKGSIILFLLFFSSMLSAQALVNIDVKGSPNQYINFLLMSEGYLAGDSVKFVNDVETIIAPLFDVTPYKEYEQFFNIYGVWKPSTEEGSDHPGTAADEFTSVGCGTSCPPVKTVATAYHTTFDFASIHRLVYTSNPQVLLDALLVMPQVDVILLIVNEPEYGGAGDPNVFSGGAGPYFGTTSLNSNQDLSIHEFGHIFGGLQDEYCANTDEAPNMTMESNPDLIKWNNWIGIDGVGVFGHTDPCTGWYYPHQACMMRTLGQDLCPVCREAIVDKCYEYVIEPFVGTFPPINQTIKNDEIINFGSGLMYPQPNTICIKWKINGVMQSGKSSDNEGFHYDDFDIGANTLTMIVEDQTAISKSYLPDTGYEFTRSWNVTKEDQCLFTSPEEGDKPMVINNQTDLDPHQISSDDFDWTYIEGSTPTSFTGPSEGRFDGYIYAEATGQNTGNRASFKTDCYDLREAIEPEFEFFYHMFSGVVPDQMGTLKLFISTSAGNPWMLLHTYAGNQGNQWKREIIDLSSYIGESSVAFLFRSTISGNRSDIAVDGIVFRDICKDDDITLAGNVSYDGYYEVNGWAKTTTNILSKRTIKVDAVEYIELNEGFEIQPEGLFEASIGRCDSGNN